MLMQAKEILNAELWGFSMYDLNKVCGENNLRILGHYVVTAHHKHYQVVIANKHF